MDIAERTLQLKEDFDSVYEAGKKAESDRFWEEFQQGGKRDDYRYAFYNWDMEYLKPRYKIRPASRLVFQSIFFGCKKLKEIDPQYVDFSQTGAVSQTDHNSGNSKLFQLCKSLEVIEDLGIKAAIYYYTFDSCSSLRKIAIIRTVKGTMYTGAFGYCPSLTDVTFEGVIGTNISFSASPLSVASLKNIISCLYDYSGGTEYGTTLTLKASAFAELEAEGATAEYNGVACTWAELIDNKKWNLTLS